MAVDVPGAGPAEDLHEECGAGHMGAKSEERTVNKKHRRREFKDEHNSVVGTPFQEN